MTTTCGQAVTRLLKDPRRWEARSAGAGSKGQRWYTWALLATASPRHHLLIRRHLASGELAFCYCFVPEGQRASMARLIRAAGLRRPAEDLESGTDCLGLGQSQVRLHTAIARHAVLVMAALAICAVTAALLRHRADTQAPPPVTPDQPPPPGPGMVPLTVPQVKHLLAARPARHPPGHADRWLEWERRRQARSRWYHQRTRLRDAGDPPRIRRPRHRPKIGWDALTDAANRVVAILFTAPPTELGHRRSVIPVATYHVLNILATPGDVPGRKGWPGLGAGPGHPEPRRERARRPQPLSMSIMPWEP
jgi:hypothetical protein